MEIKNAIISGKELLCACGCKIGNIKEHKLVEINGEMVYEFVRYCSMPKCMLLNKYFVNISVEGREVFVLDGEFEEVKDGEE